MGSSPGIRSTASDRSSGLRHGLDARCSRQSGNGERPRSCDPGLSDAGICPMTRDSGTSRSNVRCLGKGPHCRRVPEPEQIPYLGLG
jgi:hypothetical protein